MKIDLRTRRLFVWLLLAASASAMMLTIGACSTSEESTPTPVVATEAPATSTPEAVATEAPEPTPATTELVSVVTSSSILADWVGIVGGDRVEVVSLVPRQSDPHSHQPGGQDIARVADADVIFSVGLQLEGAWLVDLLENAKDDNSENVELAEMIDAIPFAGHSDEGDARDEEGHGDEDEDAHDEDEDAHGDEDAHDEDEDAHGDEDEDAHDEDEDAHGDEYAHDEDEDAHGDEDAHDEDEDAHGDEDAHDEDEDAHGDEDKDAHDEDEDAHGDEDKDAHDEDEDAHGDEDKDAHDEDEDAHGDEDKDAHDEDEDAHGDEDEHGHAHGELDPHFWFDPTRVKDAINLIAHELSEIEPSAADYFAANAAAYNKQLDDLDSWIMERVGTVDESDRLMVTTHDSFGYFADRYGFEVVGVVIPGGGTEIEPSAADLAELVHEIEEAGVKVMFSETQLSDSLAIAVSDEAGATVVGGLHTGSLGPEGTDSGTYIGMMRYDVDIIVNALSAQ